MSAVVPSSSGTWPATTVSAMPKMNPCTTGWGTRCTNRPARASPSSSRNNAVSRVSHGMAAIMASGDARPMVASMEAVMAAAAESMPKTTRRVDEKSA